MNVIVSTHGGAAKKNAAIHLTGTSERFVTKERSWLAFNMPVMKEAHNSRHPPGHLEG
ncbi:hypothetical protein [Magnetospira sp. QH-2]|uniref:hypothetical protein n=1 Tax=Magnetospira sp. (strain QH-2) TaxID=1288970 RepID=UPI0003E81557|nr:hypothetical protein [Magnetospira sp. QH-2]CCQ72854.1 protein of unknown function [Magnetospira sp. QH-2]